MFIKCKEYAEDRYGVDTTEHKEGLVVFDIEKIVSLRKCGNVAHVILATSVYHYVDVRTVEIITDREVFKLLSEDEGKMNEEVGNG